MKSNLVILGHLSGEYTVVFEELLGFISAQSCPYRVFPDWASVATALRGLGTKEERIAKAKKSLDNSPNHEFIVESANCSPVELIARAGFDPMVFN